MNPGWLESISAIRKGPPAAGRIRETTVFALRIVKSFAVLSVRDRSSGNSEETMPSNTTKTSIGTSIFPILIRGDAILQPLGEVIHLTQNQGKR